MSLYYQPGIRPYPFKLATAFFLGFFLSLIGAIGYNLVITLSPFIYFNIAATVGFGYFIGLSVLLCAKVGAVRTAQHRYWLLVFVGLIAYYFQWVAFVNIYLNGLPEIVNIKLVYEIVFHPRFVIEVIGELYEQGPWSLFGITMKGGLLIAIWVLEFTLLAFIAFRFILHQAIQPFSENSNAWYHKHTIRTHFEHISLRNEFVRTIESNPVAAILALGPGTAQRHSVLSVYSLPADPVAYLSIHNRFIGTNSQEEVLTPVIHLLTIDATTASELMRRFGSEKSFLDRFI
jgi:hypothetical protein